MLKFIGKRILMMVPVMLGVVLLVFSMMYFSPGKPEDYILGDMATVEDKAKFRAENGLNEPFIIQYFNYIKKAMILTPISTKIILISIYRYLLITMCLSSPSRSAPYSGMSHHSWQ